MGFLVRPNQLGRYPAFPGQKLPPLPLEKIDLGGLANAGHSDVAKMPKDAVTLQLPELLTGRRALHAGRAGELVNGEKSISLNVEQADCGAVCQRQFPSCHRSPTRPFNGLCPEYPTGLHCPAILLLSQYLTCSFQPRRIVSRQTH